MRPFKLEDEIEVPENVQVELKNNELIIKGPKGEVKRRLNILQ